MALAGSAIGFSVVRTESDALGWHHSFLAVAILSWLASIGSGVRLLYFVDYAINLRVKILRMEADGIERKDQEKKFRKIIRNGRCCWHWQIRFLALGAFLFLSWHITQMATR